MGTIESIGSAEVPLHLRDTHYSGAERLGHVGYQYPHDFPGHYVKQAYLPERIVTNNFTGPPSKEWKTRFVRIRRVENNERQLNPNNP